MVSLSPEKLLILEIRDETKRQVSFSALNYHTNILMWENFQFAESWWVSLLAAHNSTVLFQHYIKQENPDETGVIALDVKGPHVLWERPNFSFSSFIKDNIRGVSAGHESTTIQLELVSGKELDQNSKFDSSADEISSAVRPFQYYEGTDYYKTVQKFLAEKYSVNAEHTVEYLEHDGLVVISYYVREGKDLVNYLLVVDESGNMLLHEKLDEQLKGLGVDTFFVLSGCLFFVRNKRHLLSYKIL
jgi:hypothetical protein